MELAARVADGDERERIWAAQKAAYPGFADYERKTTRQIPVIVLEPARLCDGAPPRCGPSGRERCPGRARSGRSGWCLPGTGLSELRFEPPLGAGTGSMATWTAAVQIWQLGPVDAACGVSRLA